MLDAHSGLAQASALDLSQNGIGHFGIPRQHARLNHVSILMVGRLWGFAGVDILKHQHRALGVTGNYMKKIIDRTDLRSARLRRDW